MKRSEVINIIANYFYECNLTASEAKSMAKNLLFDLEKNVGMSPPKYEGLFSTGEKYIKELHCGKDTHLFIGWEPE